jgi:ubiquinone/menaquinone biosynthesis C-methylase UbiE
MPPPDQKQLTAQAFDSASAGYDRPALRFFDASAAALVERLRLRGAEHVLDAATGTGKVALEAAKRLPQGQVTGVDLSAGMLAQAAAKALAAHVRNVTFLQSDIDAVPFAPRTFDALTCGFGVHFWPNMETSLRRLITLVKPGGAVAFTSFLKGSFEPQAGLCLRRFGAHGVKLPDTYTIERLDHPDKNRALMTAVGLSDIDVSVVSAGHLMQSADEWWDLVTYTGYRGFLNQLPPEQVDPFRRAFLTDVEATRGPEGIKLEVNVIVGVGRVP